MAKKTSNKILIEGVLPSIHASRVDRDAGVIYGVRLGGLESKNKRRYEEAAYKKAVDLKLYEGKPCNINHVKEGEQVAAEDRFGIWKNARWSDTPEPGPVADLHYIKSHPMAPRVCEAAERPDLSGAFGMSHIANASSTRPDKDWLVIEGFESINSVDLVADPATVKGLYEQTEKKPMKQTIKAIIESACNFPFQKRLWEAFTKDEDACKRVTEEIETPETDKPADVANTAFDALAVNVVKDGSLSPKDKAAKVDAIATLQAKMLNGEEPTPAPEEKKDDGNPKESVYGVRKASSLCESLKFKPTPVQLTLISESTEPNARQLAEEFCRLSLVKPEQEITSAGRVEPIEESTKPKPAQTAEELAARIA